jgi:hypothetical protein
MPMWVVFRRSLRNVSVAAVAVCNQQREPTTRSEIAEALKC